MSVRKKKIALWFRYGPAEHMEICHTLADTIERLSHHCEVHYFGMKSKQSVPKHTASHLTIHYLPFKIDKSSFRDKMIKTVLWYIFLPYLALKCRIMGINAIFIDETLPLTTLIARVFYGKNIAVTVADFFVDIYFENMPLLTPMRKLIKTIDFASWRRLPVIFTKTKNAREFLCEKGVCRKNIYPVPDTFNPSIYHPADKRAARQHFGFTDAHLVIVHHGILHPNKGNDLILRALADMKNDMPHLRYLLVGSGPQEKQLKKLSQTLNLQDIVIFTGWLPYPEDVNLALNAADIGLVMRIGQQSDNFHVTGTLVHNMACGLPILAVRLAGIAEIIKDGESGFLFDPHNMEEFKTKLTTLAGDADLRQRFGNTALELGRELFDMSKITDQIVAPLLSMIGVTEISQCKQSFLQADKAHV